MRTRFHLKALAMATGISLVAAGGVLAQTAGVQGGADAQSQGSADTRHASAGIQVQASLEAQGYIIVETRRTLLGRLMIRAENDVHVREIVVHTHTGEIVRDAVIRVKSDSESSARVGSRSEGRGGLNVEGGASISIDSDNGISIDGGLDGGFDLGD